MVNTLKCIILCAGFATRLYPLTENFPKPLLKVGEKTILDWLIDDIDSCNEIDSYAVVSNHKFYQHFVEWKSTGKQNIVILDDGTESNETRLGAVCDIKFAVDKLNIDEDVLVIAGDNVLDFSLTCFIAYAKEKNASCIMRYCEQDAERLSKSAVVTTDENDRITKMIEKPVDPESHWCCPPFYYYTKDDLKLISRGISEGCGTDSPGFYAAWVSSVTEMYAMKMPGKRYDI